MKIYIHLNAKKGPWGGGNQFLKAIQNYFIHKDCYTSNPFEADIILFNSFPFNREFIEYFELIFYKLINKKAIFVHRLDGPMSYVRGSAINQLLDKHISIINETLSDANIFQSEWSKEKCKLLGIKSDKNEITILNAPDSSIFFKKPNKPKGGKIKLIATSWSKNIRKGFDIYEYLDNNLDLNRFKMTFVGNTPINFKNIKYKKPLDSFNLAKELRENDIFITASMDDPCSNSLIEGIHCGLIPLVRNSGGHPEIVKNKDFIFENHNDLLNKLNKLSFIKNIQNIDLPSIDDVGNSYFKFFELIIKSKKLNKNINKLKLLRFIEILHLIFLIKFGLRIDKNIFSYFPIKIQNKSRLFFKLNIISEVKRDILNIDSKEKVIEVIENIPFFLKTLSSIKYKNLYRFSVSGDIRKKIPLVNSVFALKIISMLNLPIDKKNIIKHILEFQNEAGKFNDDSFNISFELNKIFHSLRLFPKKSNLKALIELAHTRQSYAALIQSGFIPKNILDYEFITKNSIYNFMHSLDWKNPWSAGSHFSHHIFFLNLIKIKNERESSYFNDELIDYSFEVLQKEFLLDSGFWGLEENISEIEKINGVMKIFTAIDICKREIETKYESIIDSCLKKGYQSSRHACDDFNLLFVLYKSSLKTKYRFDEIQKFSLDFLKKISQYYWPKLGGFSFYKNCAQHTFMGSRISAGYPEPDLHGTLMMLWSISIISKINNWDNIDINYSFV